MDSGIPGDDHMKGMKGMKGGTEDVHKRIAAVVKNTNPLRHCK